MDDCCKRCSGKGSVGWVEMMRVAMDDDGSYRKSMECPDCHGSGGWKSGVPKHRMTLDQLYEI